ncbi:hypothetical protein CKA32_003859 [Geitlerinema sp. FC II]|nr:hypothetical protein CKA32_003859 [Geitlerinema sp. FC II]
MGGGRVWQNRYLRFGFRIKTLFFDYCADFFSLSASNLTDLTTLSLCLTQTTGHLEKLSLAETPMAETFEISFDILDSRAYSNPKSVV